MPFSATVNFSAHFFATRPRPRQPLHVALSALWLLSLTVSAPAAWLVAGPGGPGPDFVYLGASRATAGQLQTNGTIHLQPLPQGATAAVAWREQALVFCGRRVYAMALPGAWRETARFEEEVREAVAVGDTLVLLIGGARRDGVLPDAPDRRSAGEKRVASLHAQNGVRPLGGARRDAQERAFRPRRAHSPLSLPAGRRGVASHLEGHFILASLHRCHPRGTPGWPPAPLRTWAAGGERC